MSVLSTESPGFTGTAAPVPTRSGPPRYKLAILSWLSIYDPL